MVSKFDAAWPILLGDLRVTAPLCTVGEAQLEAFETQSDLLLSETFHGYCRTIGAGVLSRPQQYHLTIPGAPDKSFDLKHLQSSIPGWLHESIKKDTPDRDFLWFCFDADGRYFAFDLADDTPGDEIEYGIYVAYPDGTLERVATCFMDFYCVVCLTTGAPRDPPRYIERVFVPPS